MSVIEHLEELRRRLLVCVVAIAIGAVISFVDRDLLLTLLLRPLPAQAGALGTHRLAVTGMGEGFAVVLKLSLAAGVVLATPVWLFNLWAFVAPAMRGVERRYALRLTVLGVALFAAGITVGFVTLRYPIEWLLGFTEQSFVEIITADSYFTFVAYFLLAFGLVFELPMVLTGVVVLGLVSPEALRTHRAPILVGLWTASCFITPGADPYSPVIVGLAFTGLFFIGLGLIQFVGSAARIQSEPTTPVRVQREVGPSRAIHPARAGV